jgi:hypothetical protein
MCNILQEILLRDVIYFIMVETDCNLMAHVRASSLLTVWSGVMPSKEGDSEYDVLFLILNT